ncbi:MAG: hypothetical protein JSW43_10025 [Gemmatimonadota bacterium]|nr:MAG: hypothetical protein JSW43_10025 [Gemmatimonadota bacterium]
MRRESGGLPISVARVVRRIFGTATIVFAGVGFAVGDDPRWFVASGMCGLMWWGWDLLLAYVFAPVGQWVSDQLVGGGVMGSSAGMRPNLEEMIALLEGHLRRGTSRKVDINAAVRLEEIYRTVKKDPARAREVIRIVRERYPDAPELARYEPEDTEGDLVLPGDGA